MSHARQQVRDTVVALLNASPASYNRAYNTRIPPMQQVWPYVLVWSDAETVDAGLDSGPVLVRDMALTIEARIQLPQRETEALESRMDTVAAEIETTLTYGTVSAALAGVNKFLLVDTRLELAVDQDDVPAFGAVVMSYQIGYATIEGYPETLI